MTPACSRIPSFASTRITSRPSIRQRPPFPTMASSNGSIRTSTPAWAATAESASTTSSGDTHQS